MGISRYASPTTKELNWITQTGECNHCGSRLNTHEEAFIIFNAITGELKGLRCEHHAPTRYVIGSWDKVISVEV